MQNWIVLKILGFIGRKLDGYKTKIGGVGFIVVGILGLVRIAMPDQTQLPDMDVGTALGSISAGVTAFGAACKADKLTSAVKASSVAAVASNDALVNTVTQGAK